MKSLFENWRKYTSPLNEEQLLIEGRIDDTKKKYPELDKLGLIDILVNKDPSGNQKYLSWAAKKLATAGSTPGSPTPDKEMATRFATNLDKYHKLLPYITNMDEPFKDINRVDDIFTLETIIRTALRKKQTRDVEKQQKELEKKEAAQNSDIIYKDDDFLVVRPLSADASCYWGRETQWCISATQAENYYDRYTSEGKAFYFVFMKNRNNFSTSEYRKTHKVVLVYEPDYGFEEAYDAQDSAMSEEDVVRIIGTNLLGEDFLDAFDTAEGYDASGGALSELEGFKEDHPEDYSTILSVIEKLGYDLDDSLQEIWTEEVTSKWHEISGRAESHFEDVPAGPRDEEYQKIEDEADLRHVYIIRDDDGEGRQYWSGGVSFDFSDLDWGSWDTLEGATGTPLDNEIIQLLDTDFHVYPENVEVYGDDVRMDIPVDYDETDGLEGFSSFVSKMSDIDDQYEEIREALIAMFIDEDYLDITDKPIGQLRAKILGKEFENFSVEVKGANVQITKLIQLKNIAGLKFATKTDLGLTDFPESDSDPPPEFTTKGQIINKIVATFRQNFEKDSGGVHTPGKSHASNVLFDNLDSFFTQAYKESALQLNIPGIEAPEIKRIIPPMIVEFSHHYVIVSSVERSIDVMLTIEATTETNELQIAAVAEFIEFFDENYDVLLKIVRKTIEDLLVTAKRDTSTALALQENLVKLIKEEISSVRTEQSEERFILNIDFIFNTLPLYRVNAWFNANTPDREITPVEETNLLRILAKNDRPLAGRRRDPELLKNFYVLLKPVKPLYTNEIKRHLGGGSFKDAYLLDNDHVLSIGRNMVDEFSSRDVDPNIYRRMMIKQFAGEGSAEDVPIYDFDEFGNDMLYIEMGRVETLDVRAARTHVYEPSETDDLRQVSRDRLRSKTRPVNFRAFSDIKYYTVNKLLKIGQEKIDNTSEEQLFNIVMGTVDIVRTVKIMTDAEFLKKRGETHYYQPGSRAPTKQEIYAYIKAIIGVAKRHGLDKARDAHTENVGFFAHDPKKMAVFDIAEEKATTREAIDSRPYLPFNVGDSVSADLHFPSTMEYEADTVYIVLEIKEKDDNYIVKIEAPHGEKTWVSAEQLTPLEASYRDDVNRKDIKNRPADLIGFSGGAGMGAFSEIKRLVREELKQLSYIS